MFKPELECAVALSEFVCRNYLVLIPAELLAVVTEVFWILLPVYLD
jgi:hypothetical protein